jgi:hypothetical protein
MSPVIALGIGRATARDRSLDRERRPPGREACAHARLPVPRRIVRRGHFFHHLKGDFAMTTYTVSFRNSTAAACQDIKAKTPEQALARAKNLLAEGRLYPCFEAYDITPDVTEIVVSAADGTELAFWLNEDMRLRLAAQDLLEACEMILDADGDLDVIDFDMIRAAIAKAKYRGA